MEFVCLFVCYVRPSVCLLSVRYGGGESRQTMSYVMSGNQHSAVSRREPRLSQSIHHSHLTSSTVVVLLYALPGKDNGAEEVRIKVRQFQTPMTTSNTDTRNERDKYTHLNRSRNG
jgi:hypothetical protein